MKRIGVVASAGGSAIMALLPHIRAQGGDITVATDRACGIEEKCTAENSLHRRFAYQDKEGFSREVAAFFQKQQVGLVLLYYQRLVGAALYEAFPTINIHPSLLPAFPGMHAVAQAQAAGAETLGATAHIVDAQLDGGPMLAQIATPRGTYDDDKLSYMQKIYVTLLVLDGFFSEKPLAPRKELLPDSRAFFRQIEEKESVFIL